MGNFFDDLFLKNRIEISVKWDTCVLLGIKGLTNTVGLQFSPCWGWKLLKKIEARFQYIF